MLFRRRPAESGGSDAIGGEPESLLRRLIDRDGALVGVHAQRASTPGDLLGALFGEPADALPHLAREVTESAPDGATVSIWMSVRASALHEALGSDLGTALDGSGREPSTIVIEVWDVDVDDPDVRRALGRLLDAGFRVALPFDRTDLGEIARLDGLPITELSLDLSSLDRLGDLAVGAVRSVQALAHDIGLGVLHRRLPDTVATDELTDGDRVLLIDPDHPGGSTISEIVDLPSSG